MHTTVKDPIRIFQPDVPSVADTARNYTQVAFIHSGADSMLTASFRAGAPGIPSQLRVRGLRSSTVLQAWHHGKRVLAQVSVRDPHPDDEIELNLTKLDEIIPLADLQLRAIHY